MSQKTVAITGVDGFLGGKIAKRIIGCTDWDVLGLTMSLDMPEKMLEREKLEHSPRLRFMTNEAFLRPDTRVEDLYGVVHLAFSRRVQPAADIASSIDFAAAICHRLVALKADRVINMSSQSVYGNTEEIRTEDTPAAPESNYAMAKYASEKLFDDILKDCPRHTNFRLDLVAQSQNVVKGLCRSAKEGKISLKGGKQVFSLIDGEDVAGAVVAMLKADGDWERVYNVGWNRKRYTLVELAETVADAAEGCGYPRPTIELREEEIALWAGMDSSRFMAKTGWKPERALEQVLADLLRMDMVDRRGEA